MPLAVQNVTLQLLFTLHCDDFVISRRCGERTSRPCGRGTSIRVSLADLPTLRRHLVVVSVAEPVPYAQRLRSRVPHADRPTSRENIPLNQNLEVSFRPLNSDPLHLNICQLDA